MGNLSQELMNFYLTRKFITNVIDDFYRRPSMYETAKTIAFGDVVVFRQSLQHTSLRRCVLLLGLAQQV